MENSWVEIMAVLEGLMFSCEEIGVSLNMREVIHVKKDRYSMQLREAFCFYL